MFFLFFCFFGSTCSRLSSGDFGPFSWSTIFFCFFRETVCDWLGRASLSQFCEILWPEDFNGLRTTSVHRGFIRDSLKKQKNKKLIILAMYMLMYIMSAKTEPSAIRMSCWLHRQKSRVLYHHRHGDDYYQDCLWSHDCLAVTEYVIF